MCFTRRLLSGNGRAAVAVVALVLAGVANAAPEPEGLAAAKAAAEKAVAEEKATFNEWNGKEMARSATREIIVAARATLARAKADLAAAEEGLKEKKAAGQAPAEWAAAQQARDRKVATVRSALDKLVIDQGVGERAASDLIVIERVLALKVAAACVAERQVLVVEAVAAKTACAQAFADKAAAEKQKATAADKAAAEKVFAEKATCAEAAAKKLRAAEIALKEADAATAWEKREWALLEKAHAEVLVQIKANSIEFASELCAAETDSTKKKALQDIIARAKAEKAAVEKELAEKTAAAQQPFPDVHTTRAALRGGLKPLDPKAWDYDKARHLLVRAGFGGTPEEVAKLQEMGLYGAVDYLVDFQRRPPANFPLEVFPPPRADPLEAKLRIPVVRNHVAGMRHGLEGNQMARLRLWWLKRLVESSRPLEEKLTLFWHGHFATQYSLVQNSFTMYEQNQLFRDQAAGNSRALLFGIVHDPVMLRYLDNNTNVKGKPNENLAREIMELFAMGVDQGYTQADIREAARALTGYTYDHHSGQFRYVAGQHDDGPKTIFGKCGNWTGDDLVNLILEQPATARFVADKLFRFFAHDNPSPEMVEQLAHVLRSHHYELAPMLKNLFLSEEFYSDRTRGTQIKNPVQLMVGMLRDLGVKEVADYHGIEAALRDMGQELFEPPDVKGWREGRSWINANRLFLRYNTVADMIRTLPVRASGLNPEARGKGIDVVALLEGKRCQNVADVLDWLAKACLVRPLSPEKRKELLDYLADLPPMPLWPSQRDQVNQKLQNVLLLLLSTPEYQMT
jgi:hypothetical protein